MKRFAEVDFPIAVVSKHSAREKSAPWASINIASLVGAAASCCLSIIGASPSRDPCDPQCPEDFKSKAREILPNVQGEWGQKTKISAVPA